MSRQRTNKSGRNRIAVAETTVRVRIDAGAAVLATVALLLLARDPSLEHAGALLMAYTVTLTLRRLSSEVLRLVIAARRFLSSLECTLTLRLRSPRGGKRR